MERTEERGTSLFQELGGENGLYIYIDKCIKVTECCDCPYVLHGKEETCRKILLLDASLAKTVIQKDTRTSIQILPLFLNNYRSFLFQNKQTYTKT
jgi:hypothetical protein